MLKLITLFSALLFSLSNAHSDEIVSGGLTSYASTNSYGYSYDTDRNELMGALGVTNASTNEAFWVYCIDPLTPYTNYLNPWSSTSYTRLGFTEYFSDTTAGTYGQSAGLNYSSLFSTATYAYWATGTPPYSKQDSNKVMSNLIELYSHAYQDSITGATWSETALKSAAFQYAVWEILGDATYSRISGGLHSYTQGTTNTFQNQVDLYLDALNNDSWASIGLGTSTNYTYTVYASTLLGTSQNFLRVTAGTADTIGTTPEPFSLSLLLMGFIAWSSAKRLAKKRE